jgi:hypothetical protein
MQFKTISLIKYGIVNVWTTMRDDLPDLAKMMEDIESITEEERKNSSAICYVVNTWKSAIKLPQSIKTHFGTDLFVWTDRAEWDNETHVCKWTIELHRFRDSIRCHGSTTFETAMGGLGTKITFSGDLDWNSQKLAGLTGLFGETVLMMAENIVQNAIQKNFRKIAETITKYLDLKLPAH